MIFFTNFLVPKGSAACVRVIFIPIILVRPEYKDDKGIIAHEMVHVEQAWANVVPIIHGLRYRFSKPYRLSCEVEAYKVQLQYSPNVELDTRRFARFISTKYDLTTTDEEAYRLLS